MFEKTWNPQQPYILSIIVYFPINQFYHNASHLNINMNVHSIPCAREQLSLYVVIHPWWFSYVCVVTRLKH